MPTSKTVITTMSQSGYGQYGKRMIETFDKHWPQSIKLQVYYEWMPTNNAFSNRVEWIDINYACPKLGEFKQRHKSNPHANGIKPGTDPNGKYSYLWDAVKFAHKSYCVSHAALNANSDLVVWLDADVVTHSATKYIDGQGRVMGGLVLGPHDYVKQVETFCRSTGPAISPFNAFLILSYFNFLSRSNGFCGCAFIFRFCFHLF